MTWDNIIIPPDPTELGWKETVRISPLEDTIVAVRPIVPTLPFAVPDSSRPLNPAMPIGAHGDAASPLGTEAGFNNTDALGNVITPIINTVVSFGWEYVFHCHILSHEEMDMMRPVTVNVPSTVPPVVNQLPTTPGSVVLHWDDPTPVDYLNPATWANQQNEIGFQIWRADVAVGTNWPADYTKIFTAPANSTTWTDLGAAPFVGVGGHTYNYVIVAFNQAGSAAPSNSQNAVFGLDVFASSATVTYGDPVPTITASYLPTNPAPADVTTLVCTTTYTPTSPVGIYPTDCSGIGTPDPAYGTSIFYFPGTVTVVPKPLTITGLVATVPYGSAVPTLTPTYTGLVAPDIAPAGPPTCSTTYTPASTVPGPYPVTCSGAVDPNYFPITYVDGAITVAPAPVVVTGPSFNVVYGDPVPGPLTPTYNPAITPATTAASCTTAYTSASPVGTYPVTCSGAADPNYSFSYLDGTITVAPAPVVVTAPSFTISYGAPVPALDPTYLPAITPATLASCSTAYTPTSSVGTYAVDCIGAADPNYTFTYVAGLITVTPAAVTVTASSGTMVYGGTPPVITASYAGFLNGQTVPATAPTCSTLATSTSPVGSYASSCVGAADPNYTFTNVDGTVTVTAAPVIVTASSGTMVYGGTPPVITASYAGFLNGATAPATLPTCSTTATSTSPVGTYPSSCAGAADPNYSFSYVNGSVSVTQAALLIIASSPSMVYGGPVPAITPIYVGLVAGNTAPATAPTCSTTATIASPVGNYLSSCSGAVDANYFLFYLPGTVTVTAAPVTVTASSGTMIYGDAVPTITASYAGLMNGALAPATLPTCSTTATSSSLPGSYPSTCAGAADPNYTFTYVAGTVTVTKAASAVVVTSNRVPSSVRGQSVTFTATVSRSSAGTGAVPSGTVQFTVDGVNLGTPRTLNAAGVATISTTTLNAGTRAIVATYSGDVRYTGSASPAFSQVVNKASTRTVVTLTTPVSRMTTNTYRATVTALAPGAGTPTGQVQFYIDGVAFGGRVTLNGGVATLRRRPGTAFSIGVHAVSAVYIGSTNYLTSTSPNVTQRLLA